MNRRAPLVAWVLGMVLVRGAAFAEIPQVINYQGKVTDGLGTPVADGTYTMRFRIYDAASAGTLLWDSGDRSVAVSGGVFSVLLGESPQPPIALDFTADYWVDIEVGGDVQSPRVRLGSVGYAYMASGLVPGTEVSGSITASPNAVLKVSNTATTGTNYGLYGWSAASTGAGVYGYAYATAGTPSGTSGITRSTSGRGVSGYAAATTGTSYGGHFTNASRDGEGVYGEGGWIGIHGKATWNDAVIGVYGETASPSGRAVMGHATATSENAIGGRFHSAAPAGYGVYAHAYAETGENCGGYFETSSPSGTGVVGYVHAFSGTTSGVHGQSDSPNGRGVRGEARLYGVYGEAIATSGVTCGGYFESISSEGTGVRGVATSTTGVTYGAFGRVYSTTDDARGVYGRSYGTSGLTYGVYGRSDSEEGIGVFGIASVTTATALSYGVYGTANEANGTGVYGEGNTGGRFESPTNVGVRGEGETAGGYFEDSGSSGWAYVGHGTSKVYGNGAVSFVQNHPTTPDRVIVYACPEGDEVATYTRGTARLHSGEARVPLGETFGWVTNPDVGLTAHVTARGRCEGVFVESLSTTHMVVRELRDGHSDAVFDYIVYGLRNGFEQVSVVQEKTHDAPIPSMEDHLRRYDTLPELRKYNAFERFSSMHEALGGLHEPTDSRP